jgi:hypothetical protein
VLSSPRKTPLQVELRGEVAEAASFVPIAGSGGARALWPCSPAGSGLRALPGSLAELPCQAQAREMASTCSGSGGARTPWSCSPAGRGPRQAPAFREWQRGGSSAYFLCISFTKSTPRSPPSTGRGNFLLAAARNSQAKLPRRARAAASSSSYTEQRSCNARI